MLLNNGDRTKPNSLESDFILNSMLLSVLDYN